MTSDVKYHKCFFYLHYFLVLLSYFVWIEISLAIKEILIFPEMASLKTEKRLAWNKTMKKYIREWLYGVIQKLEKYWQMYSEEDASNYVLFLRPFSHAQLQAWEVRVLPLKASVTDAFFGNLWILTEHIYFRASDCWTTASDLQHYLGRLSKIDQPSDSYLCRSPKNNCSQFIHCACSENI